MSQHIIAEINTGEATPVPSSPTNSISSIFSEQDMTRNSPFPLHSSPLSTSALFQRPDIFSVPDSETSSRSSVDGFNLRDTTSEKIKKFRSRNQRKSSSSSDEDADTSESDVTRKQSNSIEDQFIGRAIDAPRSRIANIRRESNCSIDNEAAHEKMMKVSQIVSTGFDDITIEPERSPTNSEFRKRAASAVIGEPISVVTNAFIPHSCSPSPTRLQEVIKQCYSPSTQQMVRPNISYTPSPRHSPCASPTRHPKFKGVRSVSPILLSTRQTLKRKMTANEGDLDVKRVFIHRSNTSPLVNEKTFPYPQVFATISESTNDFASPSVHHSPGFVTDSSSSRSSTQNSFSNGEPPYECKPKDTKLEEKEQDVEMMDDDKGQEAVLDDMLEKALSAPIPLEDDF